MIKTDHQSLKYLLEHRISTQSQQKYLAKLFGYDFHISYKKGLDNQVIDALSRVHISELLSLSVSSASNSLLPQIQDSWSLDSQLCSLISQLQAQPHATGIYTWSNGVLF